MRDDRTPEQKHAQWAETAERLRPFGYLAVTGERFRKNGQLYDFSAANIDKIVDMEAYVHLAVQKFEVPG